MYPTYMIFRDLYTTEYEAPSHFYRSQIGLSRHVIQRVYAFQSLVGRRGEGKKRGERSASFLSSPGIFSAWLVKASTARYSGTLRNAGHARTISRV